MSEAGELGKRLLAEFRGQSHESAALIAGELVALAKQLEGRLNSRASAEGDEWRLYAIRLRGTLFDALSALGEENPGEPRKLTNARDIIQPATEWLEPKAE